MVVIVDTDTPRNSPDPDWWFWLAAMMLAVAMNVR